MISPRQRKPTRVRVWLQILVDSASSSFQKVRVVGRNVFHWRSRTFGRLTRTNNPGLLINDNYPGVTYTDNTANKGNDYQISRSQKARFRLINMSAFTQFYIYFEGHDVTVVEIDGVLTVESAPTAGFRIAPGQRVSVLVTGMPDGQGAYRIIAALGMPSPSQSLQTTTPGQIELTKLHELIRPEIGTQPRRRRPEEA
jgi:FtsP/CotA-like multicopper oxidase with cupredoxin domain